MKIDLKKSYADGLYTYQFTTGHKGHGINSEDEEIRRMTKGDMMYPSTLLGTKISQYLSLAYFLLSPRRMFVQLRDSPELKEHIQDPNSFHVNWNYNVLADDFNGIGSDKGFWPSKFAYRIYEASSLSHVGNLPEEMLEEEYSNVTLFGLDENGGKRLKNFFSRETPMIEILLRPGDIFVNIVCGKQYGYFNSFLVKSKNRLDDLFEEYQNATEADN